MAWENISEEERGELLGLLRQAIGGDRYPLSPAGPTLEDAAGKTRSQAGHRTLSGPEAERRAEPSLSQDEGRRTWSTHALL